MKDVFIVLSYTGTLLSRLIRIYTKDEFCHVSIALDKDLNKMYSFGRRRAYNPFIGGFVHEYVDSGTFKRFKNTKVKVIKIKVTKKQYNKLCYLINNFENNKEKYSFNLEGLFAVSLNKKIRNNKKFYCAEFVKYILDNSNIKTNLPDIAKPSDFDNIDNYETIYRGLLKNYKRSNC